LFQTLGNGTVEQALNQRNTPWNRNGTGPLKAAANKVLERNTAWNKPGTEASKPVPPMPQTPPSCGTDGEGVEQSNEQLKIAEENEALPDKTDKCLPPAGLSILSAPPQGTLDENGENTLPIRTDTTDKPQEAPSSEIFCVPSKKFPACPFDRFSLLTDFEERLAIAEYDGHQSPQQAQRTAYQDAFMAVLSALPEVDTPESSSEDWFDQRIKASQAWLSVQGVERPA
jgi:hypothetical protein